MIVDMKDRISNSSPQSPRRRPALGGMAIHPTLQLDFLDDGKFYEFEEEDKDQGSVYYPAGLFRKLYKRKEKLGEGASAITRRYVKRNSLQDVAVKI